MTIKLHIKNQSFGLCNIFPKYLCSIFNYIINISHK